MPRSMPEWTNKLYDDHQREHNDQETVMLTVSIRGSILRGPVEQNTNKFQDSDDE